MKFLALGALLISCLLPLTADELTSQTNPNPTSTSSEPVVAPVPNANTVLTFDEPFSSGAIDYTRWSKWYPWAVVINGELQNYVLDAFEFPPGRGLRIRCDKRNFLGQKYSSGAITTSGKFLQAYGYFEMKARLPRGRSLWPAFWLMPPEEAKKGGAEIDVMENLGEDPRKIYLTFHADDPKTGKATSQGTTFTGPDDSAGDHTFAVSWRPRQIVWLIDGVPRFHVEGPLVPAIPEYMLANLAIGGGGHPGPDATTSLPAYFDVQSIRVYQYKDVSPGAQTRCTFGAASVSADVVHPGDDLLIYSSLQAGSVAVPPTRVRFTLTDFYGKKEVDQVEVRVAALVAGSSAPLQGHYHLSKHLAPGIYTVAASLQCPGDATIATSTSCLYRFTVAPPSP